MIGLRIGLKNRQAAGSESPPMPSWKANGTAASGIGDVTPAWPTHVAGDFALLCVATQNESPTAPSGWTAVADSPIAQATACTLTVFYRRALSASETNPTIPDPANFAHAQIITFQDVISSGDPWDVTASAASGGSALTVLTWPTDTSTVDNVLVVLVGAWSIDSAGPIASNFANGALSDLTERYDGGTTDGGGGGVIVATGGKASAGAIGATTCDITSSLWTALTIALKPEPA